MKFRSELVSIDARLLLNFLGKLLTSCRVQIYYIFHAYPLWLHRQAYDAAKVRER